MKNLFYILFLFSYLSAQSLNLVEDRKFKIYVENKIQYATIHNDWLFFLDENYGLLKTSFTGEILEKIPGLPLEGKIRPYPKGLCIADSTVCIFDGILKGFVYRYSLNLTPIDTIIIKNPINTYKTHQNSIYIHSSDYNTDDQINIYDFNFKLLNTILISVDTLYPHRNSFTFVKNSKNFDFYYNCINKLDNYNSKWKKTSSKNFSFLPDSSKFYNFNFPDSYKNQKSINAISYVPKNYLLEIVSKINKKFYLAASNTYYKNKVLLLNQNLHLVNSFTLKDNENLFLVTETYIYTYHNNTIKRYLYELK